MEKKLSLELAENLRQLKSNFANSADFYAKEVKIAGVPCAVLYFDGISSSEKLWVIFLHRLSHLEIPLADGTLLYQYITTLSDLPVEPDPAADLDTLVQKLISGFSALLIQGCPQAILFSVQSMQHRSIQEPSAEGNVRGSQEAFTDLLRVNIALLRRLVRTTDLTIEVDTIGQATNTEYAVCYNRRLVPPQVLERVKRQLKSTRLPFAFDSAYFAPFLREGKKGMQPVGYTERTVTACAKICEGKVVVLVNGSPFALLYPYFFAENFQSLDDYAFSALFAGMTRIIKYGAFVLAILLPGLYVMALSFTPEIIPRVLLDKMLEGAQSTPMPALLEMIVALFVLEVIRIADLRMPKSAGHSVSLVAALIIGDTAIEAGVLGTSLITCVAISAIAMYTLPTLYEQIVVLRFLFLLLCGLFGPVGLAAGLLLFLAAIARADHGGFRYLYPLWPLQKASVQDGFVRAPWPWLNDHYFDLKHTKGR